MSSPLVAATPWAMCNARVASMIRRRVASVAAALLLMSYFRGDIYLTESLRQIIVPSTTPHKPPRKEAPDDPHRHHDRRARSEIRHRRRRAALVLRLDRSREGRRRRHERHILDARAPLPPERR